MRHHVLRRIVLAGLVFFLAASAPSLVVRAGEPETEHVLFQAIRRGDATLVKDLLRRCTPPDIRDADGNTPLMVAALHGTTEMVEMLLERGADPRAVNKRGVTTLLWGARDADKVRLLIEHGADLNARSNLGNTPLMAAAASPGSAAAVAILLDHGADMTAKNERGRTPLRMATEGGDIEIVRLLLARAGEQEILDNVVRGAGPAIAIAAGSGFDDVANLLLEHGADPNRKEGRGGNGLNRALLAGDTELARTMILHGTNLNVRSQPDDTPVAVLSAYNELDNPTIVELLRDRGVDFNAVNRDGQTALTWARLRGHADLIDALVEAGAPEGDMPARPEIPSRDVPPDGDELRQLLVDSVQKSIDLLQLSSNTFLDVRNNCVSCHHQNLPGVAIGWARDRGFHVSEATIERMLERQVASWEDRIERAYEMDSPFPVPPRFLGWGMWSFSELGYRPDELTRAVSWYLSATQQQDGRWAPGMLRPPLGGNGIVGTMLALRALQLYPLPGREREMADRVDRARRWLEEARPQTHQDEVSRMLGLAWAGVAPDELADEVRRLLESQRDDGGWAQLPGLESDAWATGQSLVALATAGGLPTDDPAYHRGVAMLLRTQFDDGSWYVQSRSWPFQPYFESAFPFGRDQWISAPATAWAVMALVLAVDPDDVSRLNAPRIAEGTLERTSSEETPAELVPAATRAVSFTEDIQPLLTRSCLGCHGEKEPESNFSLTSRAALIRGGDSELPAVVPGASDRSPLVRFAAGIVADLEMPPLDSRDKFPALSAEEIALLRAWIDHGARWPDAPNASEQ